MEPLDKPTTGYTACPPPFQYATLAKPFEEIRLLELIWNDQEAAPIVCKLKTYELENAPDYMALSYVWGNASIKEQLLFQFDHTEGVGHYALDISINLASALRRLRSRTSFDWASKTCLVWADAVCVNQGSVQERSQQVQIMHQIYAAATSVW
ncbi:heterokaryon incompatibility protein-domain-containing protein, partial [Massariosphaeria phaeospora]